MTHWSTWIDAFKALEYLSKDPKVNIKKVGITGCSRGGAISLMASEKRLRDVLVSEDFILCCRTTKITTLLGHRNV